MAEYIERGAAIKRLEVTPILKYGIPTHTRDGVIDLVEKQPAADVVEVVHGRWIDGAENFTCGNHNAECSVCHCNVSWSGCDEDFNYCPNCGARMDGE